MGYFFIWLTALCELKLLEMTSRLNSDLEPGAGWVGGYGSRIRYRASVLHLENVWERDQMTLYKWSGFNILWVSETP